MIKNVALFFSATDEKTLYKQILQYETVHNNEVHVCIERVSLQRGLSAGTVIIKNTKEPKNRVLLGALLFSCDVSFVVCNLCLDTYRRNCKTGFDYRYYRS